MVGMKTPTDLSAKQTHARGVTTKNVNLDRGCAGILKPEANEHEAAVAEEVAMIQAGLAKLAVKPGAKNHLAVLGNELASQFKRATTHVPNTQPRVHPSSARTLRRL